jgi:ABC-type glutathione transport system ATPase component
MVPLALSLSAPANAAGPTRAEYVEQVETICQARTQANKTVLHNVNDLMQRGQLKAAARRFKRAAVALKGAIKQVAQVPRPVADQARLAHWLRYGKEGDGLLRRIAKSLSEGERHRVQGMARRLLTTAKRGNAIVVGFGFKYCRLNPNRFA